MAQITEKFTADQITEALIAYFKLPKNTTVSYQTKYELGATGFSHAHARFNKPLEEVR